MENVVKEKGLTGYQLKIIGILFMVLDHIHQMFTPIGAPMWLTMAGRIVAPIFLYLSAEGYYYTRSREKYLFRLWVASVIMNIGNMVIQRIFPLDNVVIMNSMFGTLFLSIWYIMSVDGLVSGIKDRDRSLVLKSGFMGLIPILINILALVSVNISGNLFMGIMILFPVIMFVEGGVIWIISAGLFYFLRNKPRIVQLLPIVILSVLSFVTGDKIQTFMIFSLIPLLLYNGKPGKKSSKYFFYVFYPVHIYVLYLISYLIQTK